MVNMKMFYGPITHGYQPRILDDPNDLKGSWILAVMWPETHDQMFDTAKQAIEAGEEYLAHEVHLDEFRDDPNYRKRLVIAKVTTQYIFQGKPPE